MNKILVLSIALCMITLKAWSRSPIFNIDPGNKYIYYPEITGDPDFKAVSQLKIGPYLTLGNYGLHNYSWIGNNADLDYSSYGGDGSLGDKNLFVPTYALGTGLIMEFDFQTGDVSGRIHHWGGSNAKYVAVSDLNTKLLEKVEELTLYVIGLNRENQKIRKTNQELNDKIKKIENDD